MTNRISADENRRALRADRVKNGRSRLYSTVMFCRRRNDAFSTQRDEKIAGSWSPGGSVRAGCRKFLSCRASPFVENTSDVLLNKLWPKEERSRKLISQYFKFTALCRPTSKSGFAMPMSA